MPDQLVCIVIPVYKPEVSPSELTSLNQCLKVLHSYPTYFVGPQNLNTQAYQLICAGVREFRYESFDEFYFKNIAGYNKLMLSAGFYHRFLNYKFILLHQLDAYVFKDELDFWCGKNYDYIGAPNPPHLNKPDELQFLKNYNSVLKFVNTLAGTSLEVRNVGNGGFSLRKTRSCYWLLRLLEKKVSAWADNNEDGFFKYWGNLLWPIFRLPSDEVALHFAIEESPAKSIKALNNKLPFGCHAFEKFEPETWESYIKTSFAKDEN